MADFPDQHSGYEATGVVRAREREKDATADLISVASITHSAEREALINNLRERYRTGSYYANSRSLAARIVDSSLQK